MWWWLGRNALWWYDWCETEYEVVGDGVVRGWFGRKWIVECYELGLDGGREKMIMGWFWWDDGLFRRLVVCG